MQPAAGRIARGSGDVLSQSAEDHVYWVERAGKAQKQLALNAAPIDVAEFLRRRLFESDTSIIMTSATLAISDNRGREPRPKGQAQSPRPREQAKPLWLIPINPVQDGASNSGLSYFVRRVGAKDAALLQVGTPFDYEQQMKLFVAW